jgi:hypothetical protein
MRYVTYKGKIHEFLRVTINLKTSYSTGLQPLLKTILFRVFDFHGDAENTLALEAILFHLYNTCIHFGSLYEFCGT